MPFFFRQFIDLRHSRKHQFTNSGQPKNSSRFTSNKRASSVADDLTTNSNATPASYIHNPKNPLRQSAPTSPLPPSCNDNHSTSTGPNDVISNTHPFIDSPPHGLQRLRSIKDSSSSLSLSPGSPEGRGDTTNTSLSASPAYGDLSGQKLETPVCDTTPSNSCPSDASSIKFDVTTNIPADESFPPKSNSHCATTPNVNSDPVTVGMTTFSSLPRRLSMRLKSMTDTPPGHSKSRGSLRASATSVNSATVTSVTTPTHTGSSATITPTGPRPRRSPQPVSSKSTESRYCGTSSSLAPRVTNVAPNSWVYQRVILIHGQIGNAHKPVDGYVYITHHQNLFPCIRWPVSESHFKALIYLQPGQNRIEFVFGASRYGDATGNGGGNGSGPNTCATPGSSTRYHESWITINYLPQECSPPLKLAIFVASDSKGTFDAPPNRITSEGNNLDIAIRKFRMAAYLWQAFTAEQMYRNGLGRRSFRFEDTWQRGTLSCADFEAGTMRSQALVHIIRLNYTMEEVRQLDYAQQYEGAKSKTRLYDMAMEACKDYFKPQPGQKIYVSGLLLDSQWDSKVGTIRGHAALGGGDGQIQLGIFGSHCLYSYPWCLEDVNSCFVDCTPTDTNYVANDACQAGSSWEAANIGIGAHLHETGHLFGCPHQESGIMLRDYTRLHRSFVVREAYSTTTRRQGLRLCRTVDECSWHRLDMLRFRFHTCFRLSCDGVPASDSSIQAYSVEDSTGLISATSGVAFIEIFAGGDDVCHAFIEYVGCAGGRVELPQQVRITDELIRNRLSPLNSYDRGQVRLDIHSGNGGHLSIADWNTFISKSTRVVLAKRKSSIRTTLGSTLYLGFRSTKLGMACLANTKSVEVILHSAIAQTKLLRCIKVYHGRAVEGMEFVYEDSTTQLFGKRGTVPKSSTAFKLDTRIPEYLMGFTVRAGAWIDAIQILTSTGRKSPWFGWAQGGSTYTLIPPTGYKIAGMFGTCASWVDSLGLIIAR